MKQWLLFLALVYSVLIAPQPVSAHAFGKLYNLPVPFWMYLYGGAGALLVSFLVIGYFLNKTDKDFKYPAKYLSKNTFFNTLTKSWFLSTLKGISVFLLLLTIIAGFIGEDSAYSNFNMTFFWIFFALALPYVTALIGNIYAIINPWKVLTELAEKFLGEQANGVVKYPKNLGYYPALLFYFLFIWIELFGKTGPQSLAFLLTQYTFINIIGVMLIGKNNWFQYGEFFSVFLRLIGKIAPIEYKDGKLYLRPPFIGLLKESADHFSLLLFILFMLSSTAFDGFRITLVFYRLYWDQIPESITRLLGENPYDTFQLIGLIVSPLVFLFIYWTLIALAKIVTKSKQSIMELMLKFAFSLIPIAFVYNVAHYYNLILGQGQDMIRLISDPFGFGWNLFGTTEYVPNLSIVDAGVTWHVQVTLILIGHIAAVYLAHIIALKVFPTHKKALLSQFPMLLLMVAYTLIGLWILAQPVTGGEI